MDALSWPYSIGVYPNCMLVSAIILKFNLRPSIRYSSKLNLFAYDRAYCRLVLFWQTRKQYRRHAYKDYEIPRLHLALPAQVFLAPLDDLGADVAAGDPPAASVESIVRRPYRRRVPFLHATGGHAEK